MFYLSERKVQQIGSLVDELTSRVPFDRAVATRHPQQHDKSLVFVERTEFQVRAELKKAQSSLAVMQGLLELMTAGVYYY